MSRFAVVRHPDTGGIGTSPEAAMPIHRARGWVRVSEYRDAPADFHLPDFADASDLDAEAPKKTRRPTEEENSK